MQPKFIDECVMCSVKLSRVAAKCSNGAGTLKQDVQTFMMQEVREGSECLPMIMFSEWIRGTRRFTISVLSDSFHEISRSALNTTGGRLL